jgi:predicted MFS family arabinose efflux permease
VHDVRPQSPSPRRLTNIPITVIALLLTTAWIPKDGPLQRRPLSEIAARIDVSGIVLAATPFIDMRVLISNPRLTRTYLRGALTLLAFYTVLYGLTQWLEAAQGLSPQEAGLVLLPMGIVAAVVSQPISARNLVRGPLVVGAASLVLASGAVSLFTSHTPVAAIASSPIPACTWSAKSWSESA